MKAWQLLPGSEMKKKIAPGPLTAVAITLVLLVGVAALVLPGFFRTSCIVAGTLVETPSGPRRVEDLSVGDRIWCRSPQGQQVTGRITKKHEASSPSYLRMSFSNGADP